VLLDWRKQVPDTGTSISRNEETTKTLVLGFYDRDNLGDDAYKHVLGLLLGPAAPGLRFACLDDLVDLVDLLENCGTLICGGGDVINPYFMERTQRALRACRRRPLCYAVSVGIGYREDAGAFLPIFDHAFVRSRACYDAAVPVLGAANVTYMPDIVFALGPSRGLPTTSMPTGTPHVDGYRLGVCVAQPAFVADEMIGVFARVLLRVCTELRCSQLLLMSFNTHTCAPHECDEVVVEKLLGLLASSRPLSLRVDTSSARCMMEMRARIQSVHGLICMRYHSIVFALQEGKPFFALSSAPKVANLMRDLEPVASARYDECCSPAADICNESDLSGRIVGALRGRRACPFRCPVIAQAHVQELVRTVALGKRRFPSTPRSSNVDNIDSILSTNALVQSLLIDNGSRLLAQESAETVARLICFLATGDITSRYFWGLLAKLSANKGTPVWDTEDLVREFSYIQRDSVMRDSAQPAGPAVSQDLWECCRALPRVLRVRLDMAYFSQREFEGVHRSGWSYALSGLRLLSTPHGVHVDQREGLILDSYVDRTFHWGCRALQLCGAIPYRTAWCGFVHHTFDETHSVFNCARLLANPVFRDSLRTCKCLFTMSSHLAQELSESLTNTVRVVAVGHPTEFPKQEDAYFTMAKFMAARPARRVLHIGAWLRQPYAFYELDLEGRTCIDGLPLQKFLVRARDMAANLPPIVDYPQHVHQLFVQPRAQQIQQPDPSASMCRFGSCSVASSDMTLSPAPSTTQTSVQEEVEVAEVVQGTTLAEVKAEPAANKFVQGLVHLLEKQRKSVIVIDTLSNDAYDAYLASSIVFLSLVDAAAVNTVIECIVRNTPVFVNRLPALEEALGSTYPGFYGSLQEAPTCLLSLTRIAQAHDYLKCMDKTRFRLSTFVADVNAALEL
jgi:hypothetical protein